MQSWKYWLKSLVISCWTWIWIIQIVTHPKCSAGIAHHSPLGTATLQSFHYCSSDWGGNMGLSVDDVPLQTSPQNWHINEGATKIVWPGSYQVPPCMMDSTSHPPLVTPADPSWWYPCCWPTKNYTFLEIIQSNFLINHLVSQADGWFTRNG